MNSKYVSDALTRTEDAVACRPPDKFAHVAEQHALHEGEDRCHLEGVRARIHAFRQHRPGEGSFLGRTEELVIEEGVVSAHGVSNNALTELHQALLVESFGRNIQREQFAQFMRVMKLHDLLLAQLPSEELPFNELEDAP